MPLPFFQNRHCVYSWNVPDNTLHQYPAECFVKFLPLKDQLLSRKYQDPQTFEG